ncbi:MAG TPA: FtsX-like permease family protein [Mycobacteriales bacterium]|nr:FtsX-like permease family protein [Mycobacteriales bacterium]
MFRATVKSLLARKLRLLLSALAIVLGVSFVAGAFVLTDSLGQTFDDLFTTVSKNIAVEVRGTIQSDLGSDDNPSDEGTRRNVPATVVDTVAKVDGVAEAQGSIFSSALVVGTDGKPVRNNGAPNIGSNWVDSTLLNQQRIVEGNPPRGPDQIIMDPDYAERSGHKIGDEVTVLTSIGQGRFKLVGLARYADGKNSLGGETYVMFDLPTAQKVLDIPGAFTDVQVAAKDGVSQQTLRDRIATVLPSGAEAITGQAFADEQASDIKKGLGFFNTFLLVFAGVALFVGAFIIFNTFSILIAQRTKELALMRALGASRRQITRSVLGESVVVGLIASAVGLLAGIGVALGLKALFNTFGAEFPPGPTLVLPRTIIAAFAVGVLVTAAAALIPARRAAKIAPVAAMRDAATADRSLTRQTIGGLIVLALGVVCMTLGLTGHGLAILGVGTALAFLGVALLSPLVSRPVSKLIGALFTRRIPGRLGRENAMRNPRRTASTAAALMIGLALVSAVGVLGASLKGSVRTIINGALGADYVLDSNTSGISEETMSALRSQQGVAQVDGLRFDSVKVGDDKTNAIATSPAAIGNTISLQQKQGSVSGLNPSTMLVSDKVVKDKGWHLGQQLTVSFRDGTSSPLTIAGTYADNQLVGNYVLDQTLAPHFHDAKLYAVALVKASPDADKAQVRRELDAAVKPYPNVELQDRSQFVKDQADQINQVVQILSLLLALSVLIAVLGIINTLALSVLERTRELGLLRAVGMSRRQVKRMVRVESVVIAVFGGLLGLVVGGAFGVALQRALVNQGVTELSFPVGQLLTYLVLAAVAGVIAAWLPARRASRLNVLNAIAAD